MAIYRLETKIIGRQAKDAGGKPIVGKQVSIVAKAAYRSGNKLKDEARDQTFDYKSRAQEVVHSELLAPDNAPGWLKDTTGDARQNPTKQRDARERLWNTIEACEKRKDSQLARELVISLPKELDKNQQVEAIRDWCRQELVSKGFVVDFALHRSKDGKNPHAHVLATLRPVEGEGFGKKPDMAGKFNGRGAVGVAGKSDLETWRASWEKTANAALEKAGSEARIDHRALKDRGIERDPEPKIGVAATGMRRRGKVADPDQVQRARRVKLMNEVLPHARNLQRGGDAARNTAGRAAREKEAAPLEIGGADGTPAMQRRRRLFAEVGAHVRDLQQRGEVSQNGGGTPWWAAGAFAAGWAVKKTYDVGRQVVHQTVEAGKKVAHLAAEAARAARQAAEDARTRRQQRKDVEWER